MNISGNYIKSAAERINQPSSVNKLNSAIRNGAASISEQSGMGLRSGRGVQDIITSTNHIIGQVKDNKVKTVFENLYPKILKHQKDVPKESERMTSLMKSVEIIDNPKIKNQILFSIDYLSKDTPKNFDTFYGAVMDYAESYADAANCIGGKYLNIRNGAHNVYKNMEKSNFVLADAMTGAPKDERTFQKLTHSDKGYSKYLSYYGSYAKQGYKQTYENYLKQDAMSNFIDRFHDFRSEAVDTLYHEEYLKTLPTEIAKECADIQKKYGTYVITPNNVTPDDLKYVKEEFGLWKEAGKDNAILPKVLHVNKLDETLYNRNFLGCASANTGIVRMRDLLNQDADPNSSHVILRHEIQHLHDNTSYHFDIDNRKTKKGLEERIKWRYELLKHGKNWDKELRNGGISASHRRSALSQECELRSVSLEADQDKLSDKYKKTLQKDFNMPSWMFEIKRNSYIPKKNPPTDDANANSDMYTLGSIIKHQINKFKKS